METDAEERLSPTSEEQSTKSSQDAMRTRVRLFAEGVVKMVSPVLLALSLRKVDLKDKGSWFVRGSISPIAAVTMASGILLIVLLWLCLSKLLTRLEWLQYAASKLLVHLCAILLMCLASDILLLISTNYKLYVISVPPLAALIILYYVWSLRGNEALISTSQRKEAALIERYDREMENSLDFSAAFTALLFLGLERLALELEVQQTGETNGSPDHLESSLALSFITCVLGVAIMLVWTIPPPIKHDKVIVAIWFIEASNVALALLVTAIVIWITWAPLKAHALWVIEPPLVSFLCGLYVHLLYPGDQPPEDNQMPTQDHRFVDIDHQEQLQGDDKQTNGQEDNTQARVQEQQEEQHPTVNQEPQEDSEGAQPSLPPDASEVKPPSLELTKFAFVGFLAVSIPNISNSPHSIWAHAFILLTATSVVSALLGRLLAHRADPSPAVVRATNIASAFAHGSAMLAMAPFAVMADMNARPGAQVST